MSLLAISKSVCNYVTKSLSLLHWACVLLTEIMTRSASIMPSMMYKLLVSPPAHRGPKMVARPPTERRTPWLNPLGWRITKNGILFPFHRQTWKYIVMCRGRWGEAAKSLANLVFSLLWLWRRETPETRPRTEAPAAAETLRWWRPTAPIHNHLAATERLNKWDEWITELQLFAHKLYETCH